MCGVQRGKTMVLERAQSYPSKTVLLRAEPRASRDKELYEKRLSFAGDKLLRSVRWERSAQMTPIWDFPEAVPQGCTPHLGRRASRTGTWTPPAPP